MENKTNRKRVLITGSAGFLGHHVCEGILKDTDWEIVTIDRLSHTAKDGFDRLRDVNVYDDKRVTRFTHDLNMPIGDGIRKELGHIDYILHIAANSHVDTSITHPVDFILNNVNSTLQMLEYARKLPELKKFIYFSTDEVYGSAPQGVNYKEGDRMNPGNPYSASKASAEAICRAYANTYKLPILITNTMNIIGERQAPEKFLPLVINKVLDGETVYIHANKEKTKAGQRFYIHARNITAALLFILNEVDELLDPYDASKGVFNIVGEKEFDNLEFALTIAKYVGKELNYELVDFHSSRPGHDLRYALDGNKLLNYGFTYPVPVDESIKNIVEWTLKPENIKWLR